MRSFTLEANDVVSMDTDEGIQGTQIISMFYVHHASNILFLLPLYIGSKVDLEILGEQILIW